MKNTLYKPALRISRAAFYTTTKNSFSLKRACIYALGIITLCSTLFIFSAETPYAQLSTLSNTKLQNIWSTFFDKSKIITASGEIYHDSDDHNREKFLFHNFSILNFYAKYNALPNPFMDKPYFPTNKSIEYFSTPLIIPLNTVSEKKIKEALKVQKTKKPRKTERLLPQAKIFPPTQSKPHNAYSLFFIHTYKKLFEKNS